MSKLPKSLGDNNYNNHKPSTKGAKIMDMKAQVYHDFAKKRVEIERMENGKRKAKALHIWYFLAECLNCLGDEPCNGLNSEPSIFLVNEK